MSVASEIHDTLVGEFSPVHLEVINESHQHNVPPGSESHFKVVIISDNFAGQALLSRHRSLNRSLATQLAGPVHALSLHAHTQDEWLAKGESVPASPPCRGGGVNK